ncbi:hypothetical protein MHU86_15608 [Fragilaria crotonensis]|nr:hypothetical protein MHU86_15608 [Fragilaria crotonensis]
MKTLRLDALMNDTRTTTVAEQLVSMTTILGARHRVCGRAFEIGLRDSAKLTPTVTRYCNPEERSDEGGVVVGDKRRKAIDKWQDACRKSAEHNRVVESPDRKEDGNDEAVNEPDDRTNQREHGEKEDNFEEERKDGEGIQQITDVWHSLSFCDPHRWVLDKREHGGGACGRSAIGNGVSRDASVCFCRMSGRPPLQEAHQLNVWVSVFFVVGAPAAGGVERQPGLRDALTCA